MQPAFGLYTHIRANAYRSVFLITGMFGLIYALFFGYNLILTALFDPGSFGYILHHAARSTYLMMPYITAGGVMWLVIGYYFNKAIIRAMTGATSVERKDEPELYNMLENLCMSRGMTMPALSIIDTPELNAFASGLTRDQYTVTVTSGLLEHLEDDEIEAVLAHELTHIRNQDVRLMVLAIIIVGMIATMIEFMARTWFFSGNRGNSRGGPNGALPAIIAGIAIIAGVWFLSQLMNFALSRRREFMADAGAVELTKNPDAMIRALRKIEGGSDIDGLPTGMMEMCIDNPRSDFSSLFATHPSIDDRVAALEKFAGGREQAGARQPGKSTISDRASGALQADNDAAAAHRPGQASPNPLATSNPWSLETAILVGGALETAQREEVLARSQGRPSAQPPAHPQDQAPGQPPPQSPWRTGATTPPGTQAMQPVAAGRQGFAPARDRRPAGRREITGQIPARQTLTDTGGLADQVPAIDRGHQPDGVWQAGPSSWAGTDTMPAAPELTAGNQPEPASLAQDGLRDSQVRQPHPDPGSPANGLAQASPIERLKRAYAVEDASSDTIVPDEAGVAPTDSAARPKEPVRPPPRPAGSSPRPAKLRRPAGGTAGGGFGKRPAGQFGRRNAG